MRALLFVVVFLVGGVAGAGFYRGWFSFESDNADAKPNITLTVDKDKMQQDEKKVGANVKDFGHRAKDKAAGKADKSMDGTVVRVDGDELTMTTKAGTEESHTLAAGAEVTCDGKVCKAEDLKPGMRIRVTAGSATPHAATRVEALDQNAAFEKAG